MKVWRAQELERSSKAGVMTPDAAAERDCERWLHEETAQILVGIGMPVEVARLIEERVKRALRKALGVGL